MARYTLVYGVRLIPEGSLESVDEATLKLAGGSTTGLTLHTFDGTIPQLRRSLARSSGPALGGFLNATFGNAAELIIALVALNNQHIGLVKASITGSIVGNLLLVLGLSFFVGGLGRHVQKFHRTAATNTAAMLFLAVVALVMPAVFDLSVYGTLV